MKKIQTSKIWTLFDDDSVKKKLKVMDKWDAMMDDSRNPECDIAEQVEKFLELGKSYRVTISFEEV